MAIDQLIINSPFEEPTKHLRYERRWGTFDLEQTRRKAGYVVASQGAERSPDDPGRFVELPLVNAIRPKVKAWRAAGYPGVSGMTRRLLEHWHDPEARENNRFFFCQLEAIETLIWLTEAPASERQGIDVPGDGGPFKRLCCKMATGSGKTIVMAMAIAWQILNKVAYPQDARFSKHIFVVAPGLTVKSRLQVLLPEGEGNYYDEFLVVPPGLMDKLRQGKVMVRNWHALNWETDEQIKRKRSVDKRGAKSDEAYVREVLAEMAAARDLVVINDEAHHAWRVPAESKEKGIAKEDIDQATKWIGGLDRIHGARGILNCFDFSATPFAPSGKQSTEEALFGWVISDFGLNDAIEAGLVKTPRVVVRDDGKLSKEYRSRFYHIYADDTVKDDLNRRADEQEPLPELVTNAYWLLGKDWLETAKAWQAAGHKMPPVMITVGNRTETAARVKYAFDHGKIKIEELAVPEKTLHIDSKVLDEAESQEEPVAFFDSEATGKDDEGADEPEAPQKKLTKQQQAELLRQVVDTVGKQGKPGEQIQSVISVGMLSEGWDAKTVTHIMGLRAFSSQLLCEQVVGRGLRRTSYEVNKEGMFEPEYVNVFGVPFTFLPHEGKEGHVPPPPKPKIEISVVPAKVEYELTWPNIVRIDHVYKPVLSLDADNLKPLQLNAFGTATLAEIAPIVEGKPDLKKLTEIQLEDLARRWRTQKVVFETAAEVYDQMKPSWKGSREYLLAQLIALVESFIAKGKIKIDPPIFNQDDLRRRIVITLNMHKLVHHIWQEIKWANAEALAPIFDSENPIRSTGDMRSWWSGRPCQVTKKSHISHCVYDSRWEATESFELERNKDVVAWAKNDHLGFEILYVFEGVVRKFRPDFLVRLKNGKSLVLEVKGQDTPKDKKKREFLDEWVRAVNQHAGFGVWAWDVSTDPSDVRALISKHAR